MCRTGGRRCPGSSGRSCTRANVAARARLYRARQTLRKACSAGDMDAEEVARIRIVQALVDARRAGHAAPSGSLAALAELTPVETQRMLSETARTDILTVADGRRVVRKVHDERTRLSADAAPVTVSDAEELASRVLAAITDRAAGVHRSDPVTVYMEFIDGHRSDGGEVGGKRLSDEVVRGPAGRRLGIADHLLEHADRTPENVIIDAAGVPVGIDNGSVFQDWERYGLGDARGRGPFEAALADDPVTDSEVAGVRARLAPLRAEFVRLGRVDWWEAMGRRLDRLHTSIQPGG